MELKIVNSEYTAKNRGGLERVTKLDECVQRIMTKLQTRKGSFDLMPEFGSLLYTLPSVKPSERRGAALQYIVEALSDEPQVSVKDAELVEAGEGVLEICVNLILDGEQIELEGILI
ncbi:hypothetical protein LJC01_02230 [Clostridiaceae bacterium OttesenSCG-928-D20]|nr:hypothetical protein [Clostridiaceae bacterium OttesenSCG-928-D20]